MLTFIEMVNKFPTLVELCEIYRVNEPKGIRKFVDQISKNEHEYGRGAHFAAKAVMSLDDSANEFPLVKALSVWDLRHRRAFYSLLKQEFPA